MNHRIGKQSAAKKSNNGYLRYLRPGALAQLRDSKINARSSHLRSYNYNQSQISIHRAISSSPTSSSSSQSGSPTTSDFIRQQQQEVTGTFTTTADGELPFISARFYEPRCPQRKKLMAVKIDVLFESELLTIRPLDGAEPVVDVFRNDMLFAR